MASLSIPLRNLAGPSPANVFLIARILVVLTGICLLVPEAAAGPRVKIEAFLNADGSQRQEIVDGDQRITTPGLNFGTVNGNDSLIKRFVITNFGNQSLRVTLGDNEPQTNSPDMVVSGFFGNNNVDVIPAGESQNFQITFSPTQSTTVAEFTLLSNSELESERTFTFFLFGGGRLGDPHFFYRPTGNPDREIPYQDSTPSQHEGTHFGTLDIGTGPSDDPSLNRKFKVTNEAVGANSELVLSNARITGTGSSAFRLLNLNGGTLDPGESWIFDLGFNPSTEGVHDATFSIDTNDPDKPTFTFALRGIGKVTSVMMVSGSQAENGTFVNIADGDDTPSINDGTLFFNTQVGSERTTYFKVTNTGSGPLEFTDPDQLGNEIFDVIGFPSGPIAPGETENFHITFRPPSSGEHTTFFAVRTNEGSLTLFTFRIRGVGLAPAFELEGEGSDGVLRAVADNPSSNPVSGNGTDLGDFLLGEAARTSRFVISNTGNEDLVISQGRVISGGGIGFSVENLPTNTGEPLLVIGQGQTHEFLVRFNPMVLGEQLATVRVTHNAPDFHHDFRVKANVIGVGEIAIGGRPQNQGAFVPIAPGDSTPSPQDGTAFPETAIGETASSIFQVINQGSDDLTFGAVSISGGHAGDFVLRSFDGSPLPPGQSRSFSIAFSPLAEGVRTALFNLASSDPQTPLFRFSLSGTGTAGPGNGLPPNRITNMIFSGSDARITFVTENGKTFALTCSADLSARDWSPVPGFERITGLSTPQSITVRDLVDPREPVKFFRFEEVR